MVELAGFFLILSIVFALTDVFLLTLWGRHSDLSSALTSASFAMTGVCFLTLDGLGGAALVCLAIGAFWMVVTLRRSDPG